jgi:glycosyltransferase involved in cell wall biosynthesis
VTEAPALDTIVCLPITEWTGLAHNSRHLMKEAERRGYRILWVDPIGLRSARLQRKDVAKLTRRLRAFRRPFAQVSERIWRLAPLGIPLQGTRLGAALNQCALAFQIRRALRRLGAERVLLWSYSPYLVKLRRSIDCDLAVYYRTDDYLSAPGVNADRLRELESEAAALADLCITINELSLDDLPSSTRRRLLVRNGVDLAVFNTGSRREDPIPQLAHPRLLVIGTFDSWLDLELLRKLMLERPDWSLVLAGEKKTDLDALTVLSNVHFLGQMQLDRLPALISSCDVGLVPYRIEPFVVKGSPGKIYQYLAMGIPVVCTPFVDPSIFGDQIAVAPGEPVAFAKAIEELLRSDSAELRAARTAFAAGQSWASRFDALENEFADILAGRK